MNVCVQCKHHSVIGECEDSLTKERLNVEQFTACKQRASALSKHFVTGGAPEMFRSQMGKFETFLAANNLNFQLDSSFWKLGTSKKV